MRYFWECKSNHLVACNGRQKLKLSIFFNPSGNATKKRQKQNFMKQFYLKISWINFLFHLYLISDKVLPVSKVRKYLILALCKHMLVRVIFKNQCLKLTLLFLVTWLRNFIARVKYFLMNFASIVTVVSRSIPGCSSHPWVSIPTRHFVFSHNDPKLIGTLGLQPNIVSSSEFLCRNYLQASFGCQVRSGRSLEYVAIASE